jgi:CubicO group peptidase (beta-lactamase class C family)
MREFLPTARVARGLGPPAAFAYDLDDQIDGITFQPWHRDDVMTWQESLAINYTDGILILHRGRVVYERYLGAMTEHDVHAVMSVSKTLTGTLAAVLVAEGELDADALVTRYVPELEGSAFGDATVRQVMDMTTGLGFSEDYRDPDAEVWAFTAAGDPLPKPAGYDGPVGYFAYLPTVRPQGTHGHAFGYKTVNTDALHWIIARATGQTVDELLSDRIWSRLGMEQDGYYQIDALGIPFAGGGFNAGLRDLARFGEMMRTGGVWQGEQVIPAAAVADIQRGGDHPAFAEPAHPSLATWTYRNMWWHTGNAHGAYAARGVHGQTLYIDPVAEMVIVRLASHPQAGNAANDATSLPAYEAVAAYLMSR